MFFNYFNVQHPNIRFTMEREINKKLSFLDILLDNSQLQTTVSFAPLNYKLGLVRTLLDRVYKTNNFWAGFHLYVKKLIFLPRKKCFPSWGIDKIIRRYLSKKMNPSQTGQNKTPHLTPGKLLRTSIKSLMVAGFLKSPRLSLDN